MSSLSASAEGRLPVIDFHCHHVPGQFELTVTKTIPASQRDRWLRIGRMLSDETALLKDIQDGALDGRVVNIPLNLIADQDGRVPFDTIRACNDHMAELAARHKGRLHGLASVDAYEGEAAAREAERAVCELGLLGLFVDCARGDALIDAPQARPTLEVAARLKVPVFVHPVAPQPLTRQMVPYGVIGTLFARGTVNAAALIALVEGGVFDALPELRIVVTAHAIGGLGMLSGLSNASRRAGGADRPLREHVYVDTQLVHPVLIRAALDLLGTEHVLAGSDRPIVDDGPLAPRLAAALNDGAFAAEERSAVGAGNCARLLNIAEPASRAHAA